jgi:arylamine N-acetyltransferase
VIEKVHGGEAARLFLDYSGITPGVGGLGLLRRMALGLSRLPYENISKILKIGGSRVPREALRLPTEVVEDHIAKGFGGTCFSLTFFLERVLKSLGFEAYKVMADMNSGRNVHCLVLVKGEGAAYMIDPGYALYEVIELPMAAVRVNCPHALVEVAAAGDGSYSLWTEDASGRKRRYVFRDEPVRDSDFERYWVESFSKPTLHNICLTRMTEGGHIYLRKDFFKFTSRKTIEKRKVGQGVERLIQDEFGIAGDYVRAAEAVLAARREAAWRR